MKQLLAFTAKEITEMRRSARLWLLLVIFLIFAMLSPALAKMTPWLMSTLGESLSASGLEVKEITVNALTSWQQYYKNISLALIIFTLVCGGSLTEEYQKGTLVNMVAGGLKRRTVISAKTMVLIALWSLCYGLCWVITYGYNEYFWDNAIGSHLILAGLCPYLFGLWLISLIMVFSAVFRANSPVLAGIALVVGVSYLLSIVPKLGKYLPTNLLSSYGLLTGGAVGDMLPSIYITAGLTLAAFALAYPLFNKKQL
ncbi:MAG: ABC transporter permease subunit [Bacillota bacterium]|nr:ABC transporter permease subunit [Bacillota bacterium]